MRTTSGHRQVPDDETAVQYLASTLDTQWETDREYLGNREDMTRAWTLQNALRRVHGLPEIPEAELEAAMAHMPVPS